MQRVHRYLNSHPGLDRKEKLMYRTINLAARTKNNELRNLRVLVNMTALEQKYISFSTFASDYAQANGFQECTVTGFGKCLTDNEIGKRKVYAI